MCFRFIIWGLMLLLGLSSCFEEESPAASTPTIIVSEAANITRNSAQLCCEIEINGTETVTEIRCYYGTSLEMKEKIECDCSLPEVSVSLVNLNAGTTYYYCFEVGNGCGYARSSIYSFVTEPERTPSLEELQLKGKGPTSVVLQFDLKDDGGKPLLETGFYVWEDSGDERKILVDEQYGIVYARLGGLKSQADYMIQGFAVNDIGETRTGKMHFRTTQALVLVEAGTLEEILGDDERFHFTQLAISGPLNGADFRILREMLGCDVNGSLTPGRMNVLDLTDATIVSGGDSYDGSHYTKENIVSYGLFADCLFLEKVKLPYATIQIEKGAFENCMELDSLYIPKRTVDVVSSKDCRSLKYIEVSKDHAKYATNEGCLYSKDYSVLYWFPMGKIQDSIIFPTKLVKIEAYAFQQMQQKKIRIPNSVKELGVGAFYSSNLESAYLSDGVTYIPTAVFQACQNLLTVRLGMDTSFLSAYCFDGCSLEHLYVPVKDFPPSCHDDAFTGAKDIYNSCVLHVPVGYKNLYKNAIPWKYFKRIVDDIEI